MNEHLPAPARSGDAPGCWALLLALLSVPLMTLALLNGAGGLLVALAFLVCAAAVILVWYVERPGKRPVPGDDFGDDRCLEVHKVKPLPRAEGHE